MRILWINPTVEDKVYTDMLKSALDKGMPKWSRSSYPLIARR